MRYAIFSDIHANLQALEAVIAAYKHEGIDRYLCLGDIVGYAANPRECIRKIYKLADIIIAGNHDWASAGLLPDSYFNAPAKEAIAWTRRNLGAKSRRFLSSLELVYKNKDLTLVHGTLDNPRDFNYMFGAYFLGKTFGLMETNVCFIGHTHLPGIFIRDAKAQLYYCQSESVVVGDNKYIVNVGSIGQPRDNDPSAAYCIYDTLKQQIQIKRIDYDFETAARRIIKAGLPYILAKRLKSGR